LTDPRQCPPLGTSSPAQNPATDSPQASTSGQPQKPNTKFYSTLHGFIIAYLSAQLKVEQLG